MSRVLALSAHNPTRSEIILCAKSPRPRAGAINLFCTDAEGVRQQNAKRKDRFKEKELPDVHATLYQLDGITIPK